MAMKVNLDQLFKLNMKQRSLKAIEECFNNNEAAMGWGVYGNPKNFEEYRDEASKLYNGKEYPVYNFINIKIGDIVLARNRYKNESEFYMGIINGEWCHNISYRGVDLENRRNCVWFLVGGYNDVPKEFKTLFTPPTLQRVRNQAVIDFTKNYVNNNLQTILQSL